MAPLLLASSLKTKMIAILNLNHLDYVLLAIPVLTALWFYAKSKRMSPPLPPGPWGLPIVGNLPFIQPKLPIFYQELAKKYGPVFKLHLGAKLAIVVTSPEVAHEILRTKDVIFANHDVPAALPINTYNGKEIVWSPYGPKLRMLKKIFVNKLLSKSMLDSSVELRRRETRRTVGYLADRARLGSSVNMGHEIFCMIMNIVIQMLWGTSVKEEEREMLRAEVLELVTEMTGLALAPNISDFFPVLSRFDLQGLAKRMRVSAEKMDQLFNRIINQRLEIKDSKNVDKKCKDFLDVLLKIKDDYEDQDEKTKFTMDDIKAMFMDVVLAGMDTSVQVIEFAMAELLNNPHILKKAQEELDKVVGKDKAVEESHIPKLQYILAIVKETLRLHTIVPLPFPRCPSETTVVGGFTVPKGTKVFINVWAMHRDPNVWKNPLEFDPERFLDNYYDFNGTDLNYLPFGSGRRSCVGTAMGERVVLFNLATLLHSFDWKLPHGNKVDLEEKFGIVLKLKNPLIAAPVLRLSDPNLYL